MNKEIKEFMKKESDFYLRELQRKTFYGTINPIELKEAENILEVVLPNSYKEFILTYGSGMCGQVEVIGLGNTSFVNETLKFRNFYEDKYVDFIVIGFDDYGNYIILNVHTELILLPDHNFGGVYTLANNFEEYLLKAINGNLNI